MQSFDFQTILYLALIQNTTFSLQRQNKGYDVYFTIQTDALNDGIMIDAKRQKCNDRVCGEISGNAISCAKVKQLDFVFGDEERGDHL